MKESYLYKKLENKKTQCLTCAHRCVIAENNFGICGVRKNIGGKLYAINYGRAVALNIDPIEKKPLFHFLPGTLNVSFATAGCNFRCDNCQNWQISQGPKLVLDSDRGIEKDFSAWREEISPAEIVKIAKDNNCPSIAYTYTEPTIFLEYALDTMKLAKKERIKNVWVSNGFMSTETLEIIAPYLDAINVDLKSFNNKFYQKHLGGQIEPILENLKAIKKLGIWLEVTTLIIPTLSDDLEMLEKIAYFISEELGNDTPWHISAFSGFISWKLRDIPDTSVNIIHKACNIGKKAGLKYVYAGNVPGNAAENTYCPKCGEVMIKRIGYQIERFDKNGKCGKCGEKLDIIQG